MFSGKTHLSASSEIQSLVKGVQNRKFRSRQKHHLRAFLEYYTEHKPEVSRRDAKFLLYGDSEHKGLLETCGNTNVKTIMSLKRSSQLALNVLHVLLTSDPKASMNRFRNLLGEAPTILVFNNMKLHRHIRQFEREKAFEIIEMIISKNPELGVEDILGNKKQQGVKEAIGKYNAWAMAKQDAMIKKKRLEKKKVPRKWADVREAELNLDASDDEERAMAQDAHDSDDSDDEVTDPLMILNEGQIRVILANHANTERKRVLGSFSSSGPGSLQTCRADFSPSYFLATMHSHQGYGDLEEGLGNLERNVNDRLLHMRQLVKQHFDQFVSCKTIIDNIHNHLKTEVMNRGRGLSRTALLDNELVKLRHTADTLYKPLVERKQKTDRIRGALDVLRRFPYFFSLPGALKKHIERQEYTEVVRLYDRSKSYIISRDAPILLAVDKAVNQIVQKFRRSLLHKLQNPHATLEEHQNIIGFLEALDCHVDPTWYYLSYRADWMVSVLTRWHSDCKRQISMRMSGRSKRSLRSFRKTSIPTPTSAHPAISPSISEERPEEIEEDESKDGVKTTIIPTMGPPTNPMISIDETGRDDELSARLVSKSARFLSTHMLTFYSPSKRIVSGVKPPPPAHKKRPGEENVPAPIVEEKRTPEVDEMKALRHPEIGKAESVTALFDCVISTYTRIVRENVFPRKSFFRIENTEEDERRPRIHDVPNGWDDGTRSGMKRLAMLHTNVAALTKEFATVERLMQTEKRLLRGMRRLTADAVEFYVCSAFKVCFEDVARLEHAEDWAADPSTPSITKLPGKFSAIVKNVLTSIETATPADKPQWMVELIAGPFVETIRILSDVLHSLAFPTARRPTDSGVGPAYAAHPASPARRGRLNEGGAVGLMGEESRKVLVVLSNSMYVQRRVLPPLWDKFLSIIPDKYHEALEPELAGVAGLYATLARMVTDAYIRSTALGLGDFITRGLMTSGRDWSAKQPVTKVREYVMELLLEIVLVYDDVMGIAKPWVHKVMQTLLWMISDNFYSLMRRVGDFCVTGAMQVYVEIEFIRRVLGSFESPASRETLRDVRNFLERHMMSPSYGELKQKAEDIVVKALKSTRVMFACFAPASQQADKMPVGGGL